MPATTETTERIKTIKRIFLDWQNKKWSAVNKMDEPGFLQIEILADAKEKIKEKIQLVKEVMRRIIEAIRKQQAMTARCNLSELNIALANELAVCQDILEENDAAKIAEKIDELASKISRTMAEIRKI